MTQKLPDPLRHPTGKPMESTRLTGLLLPFKDGAPLFVHMPGSDGHLYLPVFTSTSALSAADAFMHFEHDSTKVIADGTAFVTSVPRKVGDAEVHIILDPRLVDGVRTRWLEVKFD